jgi:hypothetical protein
MSESYQLETISDLVTKVPIDRLSACLRDLEYAIQMAHFVAGDIDPMPGFGSFVWNDDGNHSVNVSLNGEPLCSLVVTDEPTPEGER